MITKKGSPSRDTVNYVKKYQTEPSATHNPKGFRLKSFSSQYQQSNENSVNNRMLKVIKAWKGTSKKSINERFEQTWMQETRPKRKTPIFSMARHKGKIMTERISGEESYNDEEIDDFP